MLDSEKIIKGLTECVAAGLEKACPADCPYFLKCFPDVGLATPFVSLMTDALSMLKEQEAVKPILEQDSMVCGVCGHEVIWQKMLGDGIWADEELDYCPHCGRKVKWDE